MSQQWRLLSVQYHSAPLNLAAEEAITKSVGRGAPNTVRIWQNTNAVVIGRNQNPFSEVNLNACAFHGTEVVRRVTGGGAVYHDLGNLNYSLFIKNWKGLSVSVIYRELAYSIRGLLHSFRIKAEFEPPNTVSVKGLKLAGLSGAKHDGSVLVHGTLLVNSNLDVLREVLSPAKPSQSPAGQIASRRRNVVNLCGLTDSSLSLPEVRKCLLHSIAEHFEVELVSGELSETEGKIVENLFEERYSQRDWCIQPPQAGPSR